MRQLYARAPRACFVILLTLCASALAQTLPRLALQYWRPGDGPNQPYGHIGPVWVDGHDEENNDGSGHWEDQDGDGNDDTWVADTHWVDGHYEDQWIQDGVFPDGQYGPTWDTSSGTYDIATTSSAYNPAATNRGYLIYPIHEWDTVKFKAWGNGAGNTVGYYSYTVYSPSGVAYPSLASFQSSDHPQGDITIWPSGLWRIEVRYHNASGISPASGTATYYFGVGSIGQSITFPAISRHYYGDPAFDPAATSSSGLPITYSIVSGPATITNGAVLPTGEGTVTVRASRPSGAVGGTTFSAASSVDQSFLVQGLAQTISFAAISNHTHGDAPFAISATASSGLPVTLVVTSGPATISGSTVTLTGGGNVTITASQAGNATYGPAPSVSRTFTVAPDAIAPSTPSALIATNLKTNTFTLTWTGSTDNVSVTQYEVLRNGTAFGNTTATTLNLTGLTPATPYSFAVRARDATGNWSALSTPLSVTTKTVLLPRVAIQYWRGDDYPNRPYGHNEDVWVEGHDEDNDDGSGHWEDRDGDGNDDTWVPDTHWVDGYSYTTWVQDGIHADGWYGSTWTTTTGVYDLTDAHPGENTDRGYLTLPVPANTTFHVRVWAAAPSENCTSFSTRLVRQNNFVTGWAPGDGWQPAFSLQTSGSNSAYKEIQYFLSNSGDYDLAVFYANATQVTPTSGYATYNLRVGALQTVTFVPVSNHASGDAPFQISATTSSGLPITYTVVSGPATVTGNTVTLNPGADGTVVLRASQAGGNAGGTFYTAGSADVSFTVHGTPQTITFPSLADRPYDAASPVLAATASSGLPVSYTVVSGPATLSGNVVTITGVGTVSIKATQNGGGAYGPAQPVTVSFVVSKSTQTITFPPIAAQRYGDPSFTVPTTASSGLPVTLAVTSGPATLAGNTVTLTGMGNVTLTASQPGSTNYTAATTINQTFAVTRIPGYVYVSVINGTANLLGGLPGTTVQLAASSPPNGWGFSGWSFTSGWGTISSPGNSTATLTLSTSDVTVTAGNAQLYTVTIQNATTTQVTGIAGQVISVTANSDSGTQYFTRWSVVSGTGGISTPTQRTTSFTLGPSNSTIRANFISPHALVVRTVGNYGSSVPSQTVAGGVRGTNIGIYASDANITGYVFDGWLVDGGSGMVNYQNSQSATFIMGEAQTSVSGWWVHSSYRANEITATVTSPPSVNINTPFTLKVDAYGPSVGNVTYGGNVTFYEGNVTAVSVEESLDYGASWATSSGWNWTGNERHADYSVSRNLPNPGTAVYRVQGKNTSNSTTTFASLPAYTKIAILTPGSLEVLNGTASASNGAAGTSVNIDAIIPPDTVFSKWRLLSGEGTFGSSTSAHTTFTFSDAGAVIQAEYVNYFSLSVINGTATPSSGVPGTVLNLVAETRSEPFVGWTWDGPVGVGTFANASSPTTTFTMGNSPGTIRANFASTPQKLNIWGGTAGQTTGVTGTTTTITATTPEAGNFFDHWTLYAGSHGTVAEPNKISTTFTFGSGDGNLEAAYDIGGRLAVENGTAEYDGGRSGRSIPISAATPPPGKTFDHWERTSAEGTGTITSDHSPYTIFIMSTGNASVKAFYIDASAPPVITSNLSASATVGVPFSYQIVATNMTAPPAGTYSVTNFPANFGLSVNSASGVISGEPRLAGTFTLNMKATNSGGEDGKALALTVAKGTQTIGFDPLPNRTMDEAQFIITASSDRNLPITFTVTGPASLVAQGSNSAFVTLTGLGNVTISAAQAGDNNFVAAATVDRTFVVTAGSGHMKPVITTQPKDNKKPNGQTAAFTVAASGTATLTYRWKKDGVELNNGGGYAGALTAMLEITPVAATHASRYSVVVTNAFGTVESFPRSLIVIGTIAAPVTNSESAKNITSSYFSATWGAVSDAHHYCLDVSTSDAFADDSYVGAFQNLDVGKRTGFAVTALKAGVTYYYRVRAVDANGLSSLDSAKVTVLTTSSTNLILDLKTHLPTP